MISTMSYLVIGKWHEKVQTNIGDMQWLIWLWVTNVVVKLNFFPHYLGRYLVTKVTERITYLKLKFAIFLESNKTLGT
jgi:hypothetical protein